MDDTRPSVLVVDDEPSVAKAYSLWLDGEYQIETAHNGEEALDAVCETTDVVLLDRRMPNVSGDEALSRMREAGYDCRVAMVTAVDPNFDIVEMPFDDYLSKPVTREEVIGTIEELLDLAAYDDAVAERFAVERKRAALESRKPDSELEESEEYARLQQQSEELSTDTGMEMDHDSVKKALGDIESDEPKTAF
ncbi:response regulator [Halolamina litorea]|uniref:Response regulator n=1 Tax=Halolamina litorea TaxID=1515593 RepID=A0ABD6BNR8_9EURY|nr:response regulator [Halolamina litorea]